MNTRLSLTTDPTQAVEDILKVGIAGFTVEKLLTAVVAAAVCLIVIKLLLGLLDRAAARTHMEPQIKRLIRGLVKGLLIFLTIIVAMGCMNIPVTSLVALLSVAGLAFSLALQGFLSNVAGGLQIVASKPYRVGDYIEVGSCAGTVAEIGLFYTKLNTSDNKLIQLPNSSIISSNIINYTAEGKRRVDLTVTVSYDAPPERVKAAMARMIGEHPLTLATPEPMIHVKAYQESSIEYIVRAWCATDDYWTVYYDLLDRMKPAFDKFDVEMSYPHLNVHMMDS